MGVIDITPGSKALPTHFTYCPRCQRDDGGSTSIHIVKSVLPDGRIVYTEKSEPAISRIRNEVRKALGTSTELNLHWVELDADEKVPANDLCGDCVNELAKFAEIVSEGGVYVRCNACSLEGVAVKDSRLAISTREHANVGPKEPTGFSFDTCEQHSGVNQGEPGGH